MTYPKDKLPRIATDATFTSGPDTGQPTRTSMSGGEQAQGVLPARFPAAKVNWLLGVSGDHLANLVEMPLRTWDRCDVGRSAVINPTPAFANDDEYRGLFAYGRGTERAGRLHVFGVTSSPIYMRSWWTAGGHVWRANTWQVVATGRVDGMAANPDGSIVVAVGGMGNKARVSTDGGDFIQTNTHGAFDYVSVCYSNGFFYAVPSSGNTVGKSADGLTWTATAAPSPFNNTIIRAGKIGGVDAILAISSSGSNASASYSVNGGASWTSSGANLVGQNVVDLRYSELLGLWMVVSRQFGVSVSVNGVSWVQWRAESLPVSTNNRIYDLACDGGGALVVSGCCETGAAPGPFVAYSIDAGVSWTGIRLDEAPSEARVCWHPVEQRFYALCHVLDGSREHLLFRTPSFGQGGGLVL